MSRIVVGVLTSACATIAVNVPASAGPERDWTTLRGPLGFMTQACKVLVDDGASWKIVARADATGAKVGGTVVFQVYPQSRAPGRHWSSGRVAKGARSSVGSVLLPRQQGNWLFTSVRTDSGGSDGPTNVGLIGRC